MKFSYISLSIFIAVFSLTSQLAAQSSCIGEHGKVTWYVYDDIPDNELQDMYVDPSYPMSPTYDIDLISLSSTYNFKNTYGSVIRGFIKVPVSGEYIFNVTGNDRANFYFSETENPEHMSLMAYSPYSSGRENHTEYPEQTSTTQTLTAGNYHYFELHHKESMYSDHAIVYWKTPQYTDTLWRVVNASNLYKYDCFETCPPQGTPCNDGIANTTNDVEDGYCNCIGEVNSSNSCVGPRGNALALFFENIPGGNIEDLYNAPNYPLQPDTAIEMEEMKMPYYFGDEYGTLVKGYIRVPKTGNYTFNVTGDDDVRLFLSTNSNPSNINLIASIDGWTNPTDHYKYPSQTSASINLNKSNFYYYELHQKEGGGGDHSSIYWKTPFRPDTNWMTVQGLFLYGFDCEAACVPQGTACDDHDPTTNNDAYDANCDCIGTPCGGPCDDIDDYVGTDFCAPSEGYSNNKMDSWLSCQKTTNPNPVHGNSHWIMYDFGESLTIERNRFWNYNVKNNVRKGAKNVIVDYANTVTSWTNLGTYLWAKAPGTNGYQGDSIVDLNGIQARYVLITITAAWNQATCAGFSEILFDVRRCRPGGTSCDDGNPLTHGDMYDNDCNCIGLPLTVENPCDNQNLTVASNPIPTDDYNASDKITGTGKIPKGNLVTFTAGNEVELNQQFEVKKGSSFLASIAPCVQPLSTPPIQPVKPTINLPAVPTQGGKREYINVNQTSKDMLAIQYRTNRKGPVSIYVINAAGEKVVMLRNKNRLAAGLYEKNLPTKNLKPDQYTLVMETKNNMWSIPIDIQNENMVQNRTDSSGK